jgi:hypothetical protein
MLTMAWKKSSFSGNTDNSCVEARLVEGGVETRNSKNPDGPSVTYTTAEWAAFLGGVKAGEFDS